jgi:hypothetical protein
MMLGMVHQMGYGRRIEECGQPHQRDDETERDQTATEVVWATKVV